MNAVTRWRGPTLSLPVERDSILDQSVSTDQYKSKIDVIAIEGVTLLLLHFNLFCNIFVEKQNVPFLSPWMCNTSCFLWRCNYIAVTPWSCSSTCPGVIAPSTVCMELAPPHRGGGASVQTFIWMWRAVSSFLVCFVIECAPLAGLQALQLCVVFLLFTAI